MSKDDTKAPLGAYVGSTSASNRKYPDAAEVSGGSFTFLPINEPIDSTAWSPRQEDWKVVAENAHRRIDAMARERRGLVSSEAVARLIERQEIAPVIKQRLIAEIYRIGGQ